jgi:hypothetical protein
MSPRPEQEAPRPGPQWAVRLGLLAVAALMGVLALEGVRQRRADLVAIGAACLLAAAVGLRSSLRQPGEA